MSRGLLIKGRTASTRSIACSEGKKQLDGRKEKVEKIATIKMKNAKLTGKEKKTAG